MSAEDVMVEKTHKQIKFFASKLPQLVSLAASVCILGCAGTRNDAERQPEASKEVQSNLPASSSSQTEEKAPGKIAPANASQPAVQLNEQLNKEMSKAKNGTSAPLALQYHVQRGGDQRATASAADDG
jgi:hypothetical protein